MSDRPFIRVPGGFVRKGTPVERIREALWIPQARRFIAEHFGNELVGTTYHSVHMTPTIKMFRTDIQAKKLNIVQGTTGCGKTLGAMIKMYNVFGCTGKKPAYLRATDLSLAFGRGGYISQAKSDRLEELEKIPWIVVDDLGAESLTDKFVEIFFHLVDIWAKRMITGIFITNLAPKEHWPERYGARTWSRIIKWSGGEVLRTADPDFRVHPESLNEYPIGAKHVPAG